MREEKRELDRRGFLKTGLKAAAGAAAFGSGLAAAAPESKRISLGDGIPVKRFGRTEHRLPILGHGGSAIIDRWSELYNVPRISREERVPIVRYGYDKGIRYLSGGGYDTFAMQVLSPQEIDPAKHGMAGDLRLIDIEDEDHAEVTMSAALIRRYKENLDAYCGKLRDFCVRRGVMHLTIDTATDIDALLLDYLRKRGLLK